jgi:hypothetical protein
VVKNINTNPSFSQKIAEWHSEQCTIGAQKAGMMAKMGVPHRTPRLYVTVDVVKKP